jgi:hypothetical protein
LSKAGTYLSGFPKVDYKLPSANIRLGRRASKGPNALAYYIAKIN